MNKEMNENVLLTNQELVAKIKELAEWINFEYRGTKSLIIVGVMKGVFAFYAELVKHIKVECFLEFMSVSSYAGTQSTYEVKILKDIDSSVAGKDVLLLDCIVDTGITLNVLRDIFLKRNPASLKIMVLLDKKAPRKVQVPIDKSGFEVPNFYLFGFGLDVNGNYRNLDCVKKLAQ